MKEWRIFHEVRVAVHIEFATFLVRAVPGILPGRRWTASMPRSGSIPTHSDLPGREVLAALRPAPDPGRLIAIEPDLDPIGPDRRFEPLLENRVG
jgi:hypothetical protein